MLEQLGQFGQYLDKNNCQNPPNFLINWVNLDNFWTRMIARTLPIFSSLVQGSSGCKSKVIGTVISVDHWNVSGCRPTSSNVILHSAMTGNADVRTTLPN